MQCNLYRKRREQITANPQSMADLDVSLDWFKYNSSENIVKGDTLLEDGRRIVMMTTI